MGRAVFDHGGEIVIHRKGDYQYNLLHLMQLDKAGESEETTCQENTGFIYCVEVNLDDVVVIRLVGLHQPRGIDIGCCSQESRDHLRCI